MDADIADPREVLLELSPNAAMVVLGSRGLGQLRSLLLGSVGIALVRHAYCPIVVHRPGSVGTVRNGIVVGVEASEESHPVLKFAYREASLRKVRHLLKSAGTRGRHVLQRLGFTVLARPEGFVVEDVRGPLIEGEVERAVTWGRDLARLCQQRRAADEAASTGHVAT